MSTKLFKNTEGKVLMSVGNKLIKQPYEFGLAFQNRMGLNNYVNINNLALLNNYGQSLLWVKNVTQLGDNLMMSIQNTNLSNYYLCNSNATYSISYNNINAGTSASITGVLSGSLLSVNFVSWILRENNKNSLKLNGLSTQNVINTTNIYNINQINIGYTNLSMCFNRYILFSRELSNTEYLYNFNNKLGNDLQTITGLEIDLRLNKAEILDFSALQDGSDMRVGCRDYSGFNRHGEIMNLPAGTLQQKTDYANANLFVPFQ